MILSAETGSLGQIGSPTDTGHLASHRKVTEEKQNGRKLNVIGNPRDYDRV